LTQAEKDETVLIGELDFALSRSKRIVARPGTYETTVFQSRRPELYQQIIGHNAPDRA
jgi:hypothetical protein